jgi:hypothetical protein
LTSTKKFGIIKVEVSMTKRKKGFVEMLRTAEQLAEDNAAGSKRYPDYFDEGDDNKQLAPLPQAWMDASRFKVGDEIEWLEKGVYAGVDLKGRIAVVTEVWPGRGSFPSRWVPEPDGDGFWDTQRPGWLVVDFGPEVVIGHSSKNGGPTKPRTTLAAILTEEGVSWRRHKKARGKKA